MLIAIPCDGLNGGEVDHVRSVDRTHCVLCIYAVEYEADVVCEMWSSRLNNFHRNSQKICRKLALKFVSAVESP